LEHYIVKFDQLQKGLGRCINISSFLLLKFDAQFVNLLEGEGHELDN